MDPVELIQRADKMHANRGIFAQHWEEIRRVLAASAAPFIGSQPPGAKVHQDVFDNTGEIASEQLASALNGSMTSPSARWFAIEAEDPKINETDEAGRWLEHATDRMYGPFNSVAGNFASQIHETYLDLVAFGTACLYVADEPGRGILFSARPLREIYLAEDAQGRIDTVFRRYKLTARQAAQRFKDGCPEEIREAAKKPDDAEKEFEFLHAVFPRADFDATKRDRKNKPIASFHISIECKCTVEESGYDEMPFMTPRWTKRAGEVYGRGPGMKALADVKMLQRMMRTTIRSAEKVVDPPLLVPDDGVMGPVRTAPSALNVVRADMLTGQEAPIRPMLTGGRPDLGEEIMKSTRERIEAAMYYNLLNAMMRNPEMTATQANLLAIEVRRILGPVLGRLESELLGPLIQRVFQIMLRAGAFDPPPAALHGQKLKIVYVSPIAKAQRAEEALAIEQTFAAGAQAQQLKPDVLDNIDVDASFRRLADLRGFPKDLLRDVDAIKVSRDQRQQQAAAQAQTDQIHQGVATAATAAKALPALRQALGPDTAVAGQA
jgi:hypothetical protein